MVHVVSATMLTVSSSLCQHSSHHVLWWSYNVRPPQDLCSPLTLHRSTLHITVRDRQPDSEPRMIGAQSGFNGGTLDPVE